MRPERVAAVAGALVGDGDHAIERVLVTTTTMLQISGACVSVIDELEHQGALAVSGPDAATWDELQFDLGEGPAIDASTSAAPVLEADLEAATQLWPAFAPAAIGRGCRAVFSFPMRVGVIRVGVLTLYRREPGPLSHEDLTDAASIARVLTHLTLTVADDLVRGALPGRLQEVLDHRRVVHQATGIIVAQLDVDPAAALAQLRAVAWSLDRPLDAVAEEVVRGELRLDRQ